MAFKTSLLFHSLHFLALILILSITVTEEAAVRGEGHGRSLFMNPIDVLKTVDDFKTKYQPVYQAAKNTERVASKTDEIYEKINKVLQSNCLSNSNGGSGSGITCPSGNDCQQNCNDCQPYCNDGAVLKVVNCYNSGPEGLRECFPSGTPVVPNQDTTPAIASGEREYKTTGLSWVLFMFAISFAWMF